ncbi:MAG TPA: ribosome biogenesis GTPase YlqF [Defluviitoga tunisiensis]|nr:ribosome biogenesis GTPase YlqF [Defluviitoga tunisiensis]
MWYPGHIEKAKSLIKQNLKLVDAVIEVLDARAPYTSRAYEEEELFRNKKRIILLNKYDICDKQKTKQWEDFYRQNVGNVFSITSKNLNVKDFFVKNIYPLVPEKFNERRVMIVGIPNVGKSTFINSLRGKKTAAVGAQPGITKGIQWINVSNKLKVLDTPGVLYPKLFNKKMINKLIIIGSLKAMDEELDEAAYFAFNFLKAEYPQVLDNIIEDWHTCENAYEFIELFCSKRNFLKKGNLFDYERGRNTFLNELSIGKYGGITYELPSELI